MARRVNVLQDIKYWPNLCFVHKVVSIHVAGLDVVHSVLGRGVEAKVTAHVPLRIAVMKLIGKKFVFIFWNVVLRRVEKQINRDQGYDWLKTKVCKILFCYFNAWCSNLRIFYLYEIPVLWYKETGSMGKPITIHGSRHIYLWLLKRGVVTFSLYVRRWGKAQQLAGPYQYNGLCRGGLLVSCKSFLSSSWVKNVFCLFLVFSLFFFLLCYGLKTMHFKSYFDHFVKTNPFGNFF